MKTCKLCDTSKNESEFYPRTTANGRSYVSSVCRSCFCSRTKEYRKSDHYKTTRRTWDLKTLYGITIDDYNKMLVAQNHRCAICDSTGTQHKQKKMFLVDHCHKTGKVRGLLCSKCNVLLGQANDNIEILKRAISYLK